MVFPHLALAIGPEVIIVISVVVLILFSLALALISRFKRCPSNKVLVVYGSLLGKNPDGTKRASKCLHDGGTLVLPVFQSYKFLDLTPISLTGNA